MYRRIPVFISFRDETDFTYYLTQPADEVIIKIFTLSGRLFATLDHAPTTAGFNHVHWNGLDTDGDALANGVYLYKLVAKLGEKQLEDLQKCVVVGWVLLTKTTWMNKLP